MLSTMIRTERGFEHDFREKNTFSEKGTEFIDGLLFKIGDKTEDGKSYYAYSENKEYIKPVLAIDANWVDAVIGLYDNPPIKK